MPAYKYGLSRPFGSKRRWQASKTEDFLTRILDANSARGNADPRISVTKGVAMAANVKTFGGAISEALAPAASCSAIQAAVGCKASTASHTKHPDADSGRPV